MRRGLLAAALLVLVAPVAARATLPWTSDNDAANHKLIGLALAPGVAASAVTLNFVTPCAGFLESTGVNGSVICGTPLSSVGVSDPISTTGGATPTLGLKFTNVSLKLSGAGALGRAAFTGGDVTAPDDSNVLTIVPNAVTFAKMQTFAGPSVMGVATASTSIPAPITSTASGDAFWNNGTALQWSPYPYSALAGAPSSLPPSGAAAGDLGATYPAPTVLAAEFGAVRLTFSTTADGALLKRSGSTVAPAVPGTDYVVTVRADGIATGTVQLASVNASSMVDGTTVYVDTVDDFFKLQASTATADNITIVNASGKAGFRWIRMGIVSLRWQAVGTFNIDPSGGNDENDGTVSPLKTYAEWSRRTHGITLPGIMIVNLLNDAPDGDTINVNFNGATVGGSFLELLGSETVVATQTVTAAQARSATGNLANEITTAGNLSSFVNDFVRVQSTTNYAVLTKAVGAGVARLSELVTASGAQASSVGVTAGQVVEVVQTRKAPLLLNINGSTLSVFVADLRFDGSGAASMSAGNGAGVIVGQHVILGGTSSSVQSASGFEMWASLIKSTALMTGGIYEGDTFTANTSFQASSQQFGYFKLRSSVWQAAACNVASGVLHLDGDFGTFDLGSGQIGIALNGGTGVGESALMHFNSGRHYGGGNNAGANAWFVGIGSWASYPVASPPTMNAGQGININGINVAVGTVPIAHNPITGSAVYALGGSATPGVLAQDAAGNLQPRTFTSMGGTVVITNPSGAGNINLEAVASGLAAPGSPGILVWTGSATAARTLTNGDGTISYTNPDGVAGNPEIHVNAIPESKVTNLVVDLAGKQATGNYLTGLASAVTATGPGTPTATVHLDAGATVAGLLPLANITPSGTVGWVLTTVSVGTVAWQAQAAPGVGTVTNVSGTAGQINVVNNTSTPIISLVAKGPGAGAYGGSGIAGFTLDAFGAVLAVTPATYQPALTFPAAHWVLDSTGSGVTGDGSFQREPGTNLIDVAGLVVNGASPFQNSALIVNNASSSNRDRIQIFVGGGGLAAAAPTGDSTLVGIFPHNTAVEAGATSGIYATFRAEALTYTGTGQAITEATGGYFEQPTLSGVSGLTFALHAVGTSLITGDFGATGTVSFQSLSGVGAGIVTNDSFGDIRTTGSMPAGNLTWDGAGNIATSGGAVMYSKDYYFDIPSASISSSPHWIATSSPTVFTSSAIEYAVPYAVTQVHMFISGRIMNNPIAGGLLPGIEVRITKNGTSMVGVVQTFGLGVTGNFNGIFVSTTSFAAGDMLGAQIITNGSVTMGGGNFTGTISFGWDQQM